MKHIIFPVLALLLCICEIRSQTVVLDFETPPATAFFQYFGNGNLDNTFTSVIPNPDPGCRNSSANVSEFVRLANVTTYAGAFTDLLTPIDLTVDSVICIKVWFPRQGLLALKVEGSLDIGSNDWIYTLPVTDTLQWVELCYNTKLPSIESPFQPSFGFNYPRLTLLFDFGSVHPAARTYYFDDVIVKNQGALPGKITVTTASDQDDPCPGTLPGGEISLREAVKCANPGDTICFDPCLDGIPIVLTKGQIPLDKDLVIIGNGELETLIDGNASDRIFRIISGNTIELWRLTIANGFADFGGGVYNENAASLAATNVTMTGNSANRDGGGLWNNGTFTATNSTISDNSAVNFFGGGVWNNAAFTATNSTISGNYAKLFGGGVRNTSSATFAATNVTISGNRAEEGGGVWNPGPGTFTATNTTISGNMGIGQYSFGGGVYNAGTFTATNVTISGNSTGFVGGGVRNQGAFTATNVTITGNSTSIWGGGVDNSEGTFTATNTIIWGNNATAADPEVRGGTQTYNYSVVEGSDLTGTGTGNLDGTLASSDPVLGPLADNGGPTRTHALLCGSAAFNAAHPATVTADQRDVAVQFGRRDMGAYESEVDQTDGDGDGYCAGSEDPALVDCDDVNPDANPGASEICGNGVDDNCSGVVDDFDEMGYCCGFGEGETHYIGRVQALLNGVDNMSGNDFGYGDFTLSHVMSVNPYFPYLYFILYQGGSPGMKHWQVYADWNKDMIFSPGEKIVDYCTSIPYGAFVPVPPGFNGSTRLRVVMKSVAFGCSPADIPAGACGDIVDGEVEDYTVEKTVLSQAQSQLQTQSQLQLYPNPVSDEFYLTFIEPVEIGNEMQMELVNSQGQVVLTRMESYTGQPLRIDASGLAAGTYFLRVNTGADIFVETVVKQ